MSRENIGARLRDLDGFLARSGTVVVRSSVTALGEADEMASYGTRALCVIAAAGAFALSVVPPAEATITLGPCTITALKPTPVAFRADGTKVASGQASVRCSEQRQVSLELFLYGEDTT
jgi:hypothetical protein